MASPVHNRVLRIQKNSRSFHSPERTFNQVSRNSFNTGSGSPLVKTHLAERPRMAAGHPDL